MALDRGISRFRSAFRLGFYTPVVTSIVAVAVVWRFLLQPENGLVNTVLGWVGIDGPNWLQNTATVKPALIIMAVWKGLGYSMLLYLAALQSVPRSLYEAASLDGAGAWHRFWSITLPMMRRPLLFVLVADTVANFVLFVPIQLITKGGPESSTTFLMFDAYRSTFGYGSRNLGAAEVVVLTVIMLFFVSLQFRLLREDKEGR